MRIGNADTDAQILLVAEIGNNHEGSSALAQELIETAFACGADAVKLQTFVPELYVTETQSERLEMLRNFALPHDELQRLLTEYESRGLILFSTPFDLVSLGQLASAPLIKISSGDITFVQLIEQASRLRRDLIISTGASTLSEVKEAVALIKGTWNEVGYEGSLAVLHCVSAYPAPPGAANLRAIGTLKEALSGVDVGYSDHAPGIDVALTAAAAGARIIEKHFTLDRKYSNFRDHELSADPKEFKQLREKLLELDEILGTGAKVPHAVEQDMRANIRRSVTSSRSLPPGHQLEIGDLEILRPGDGIAPSQLNQVVGRILVKGVDAGHAIKVEDLR